MTNVARAYGWKPDLPDKRDRYILGAQLPAAASHSDLRAGFPQKPYDQGQLGSCTGNGIAGAIAFDLHKQALPVFMPSRLFIYYNERALDGDIAQDAGSSIRQGAKVAAQYGAPDEKLWPYDISQFAKRPPKTAFSAALKNRAIVYSRVTQSHAALRSVLTGGTPIVFGFTVYESFESEEVSMSGLVPMPDPTEGTLGGHCVVLCGHDDATELYLCRNSWGTEWGQKGYFQIPYDYLEDNDLADDFWTIAKVT